jgi:hypothetical protein
MMFAVAIYLTAIAVAELVGVFIGIVPSLIGHAVLIIVLLGQYALQSQVPYRRIFACFGARFAAPHPEF